MSKIFAIADIHGCHDQLVELLEEIYKVKEKDDQILFLGDYIDRGPDSLSVLLTVMKEHEKGAVCLLGNHEDMFLAEYEYDKNSKYYYDYSAIKNILDSAESYKILRFLKSLPLYHFSQSQKIMFVHAGVNPDKPFFDQDKQDLIWIRNEFLFHPDRLQYPVVHGHTQMPLGTTDPKDFKLHYMKKCNESLKYNLDMGCTYGAPLISGIFENGKMIDILMTKTRGRKRDGY